MEFEFQFEFRHIPKTAGSSIENALKDAGVNVGLNDEAERSRSGPCQWHNTTRLNPNAQTWCVVREPLERFVSEHKYQSWNKLYSAGQCSVDALNDHVNRAYDKKLHKTSHGHCHYIPQSEYECDIMFDFAKINTEFPKFAHDVLGVENISFETKVNTMTKKCELTVDDLTEDSKRKLREMYAEDIKMYDIMRS